MNTSEKKYEVLAILGSEAEPIHRIIAGDRAINDLAHFACDRSPFMNLNDTEKVQLLKKFLLNKDSKYEDIRNIVVAISHTTKTDTVISALKELINKQKPEFCAILNLQLYRLCFKNSPLFYRSLLTLRLHAHQHKCPGYLSLIKSLILLNALKLTDVLSPEENKIFDQSFWAARNNNLKQLSAVCDSLPSINFPPEFTPLHHAAIEGSMICAEYLLSKGADVNHPSLQGMTPIFDAARKGNAEMVALFIDHGADVNYLSATGYTPLCAAAMGNTKTVELLISRGALLEVHGRTGYTPLLFAISAKNISTTQQLLESGANPNHLAHGDQKTALQIAIEMKNQALAILLIQHGADLYRILPDGQTLCALAQFYQLDTPALIKAAQKAMNLQKLAVMSFISHRKDLIEKLTNPNKRSHNITLDVLLQQRDKLLQASQKLPHSITSQNPDLCSAPHHWLKITLLNFLNQYKPIDLEASILTKIQHAIESSDKICQKFIETILSDCNPSIINARLYDKLLAPLNTLLRDATHESMIPSVLRARALVILFSYMPCSPESSILLQLQKLIQSENEELPTALHSLLTQDAVKRLTPEFKERLRKPLIQMITDYNKRMQVYKNVLSVTL